MQYEKPGLLARILPFIGMGIFIVLVIVGLIFLSYILIIGAIIGLFLFLIAYIKQRFFPAKYPTKHNKHQGRTFNHDEFK